MVDHDADTKHPRRHAPTWTAIGAVSLLWFLFRTGSKPQRAAYPCQQAALASGLGVLSYLASLAGVEGLRRLLRRRVGTAAAATVAALLLALVSAGHPGAASPARAAATGLPSWTSATAVSSTPRSNAKCWARNTASQPLAPSPSRVMMAAPLLPLRSTLVAPGFFEP